MCLYNGTEWSDVGDCSRSCCSPGRGGGWFQLTSCGGTGSGPYCVGKQGRASLSHSLFNSLTLFLSGFPNSAFMCVCQVSTSPCVSLPPRHNFTAGTLHTDSMKLYLTISLTGILALRCIALGTPKTKIDFIHFVFNALLRE